MANYTIDKIKYGNDTYIIKDSNASTTDNKVSLTADSTNEFLPVTFKKGTASPAGIYYNNNITVNPLTGTINATAAKFNNLGADKGIFKELVATTGTIDSLDVANLTATNAKVVGLLDVKGDLHTNSWTNSNISSVGGSFYVAPTVSTTIAANGTPMSIAIGGSAGARTFQVTGGAFVTDAVKTYNGTTTSTVTWSVGSHVMVTGNIRSGTTGVDYPLGTLNGYLASPVTTGGPSALVANGFTIGEVNSPALETIISELGTSNLKSYEIKISMYEIGPKTSIKPVGIMMTSYGVDKSTYIDIYGGVNVKNSSGVTIPNVRIGYLGGLGALSTVNGETPTGWGIYTDNGYFNGVIVSQSGKIGGFTIGRQDLHNGNLGAANSVWMSTGTTGSAAIGGSDSINNWAFTASDKFGVTKDGTLYATGAHIAGDLTASSIVINNDAVIVDENALISNSAIETGGRNLLLDTGTNKGYRDGLTPVDLTLETGEEGGFYKNLGSSDSWVDTGTNCTFVTSSQIAVDTLEKNNFYTLSVYVRSTISRDYRLQLRIANEVNGVIIDEGNLNIGTESQVTFSLPANDWTKIAVTFKVPNDIAFYSLTSDVEIDNNKTYYTRSGTTGAYTYTVVTNPTASALASYYELSTDDIPVYARILYGPSANHCVVYVKEWKLERGNQDTDWVPAVEDMANKDDIERVKVNSINGSIVEFDANNVYPLLDTTVFIEPTQSFNGYDKPWVGGAGKNRLPLTVDGLKSLNTNGTWSGNAYTKNGVTFTVKTDNGGNVIGITTNGTATANSSFVLYRESGADTITRFGSNTDYKLNGNSAGGSPTTWYVRLQQTNPWSVIATHDVQSESGASFNTSIIGADKTVSCVIGVDNGVNVSGKTFYPMIRLASETDATYEPYENICPISGHDSVSVTRTGKNLLQRLGSANTVSGVTYTPQSDGSVKAVGTSTGQIACYIARSQPNYLPAGNYILSAGADASVDLRVTIVIYGSTTKYYEAISASDVPFTYDGKSNMVVYMRTNGGNKAINGTLYPMIRLATETDSTYEPYQGNTYTTALGRTVYGGTLDVTTGVLTVDRGFVTYDGSSDEQWNVESLSVGKSFYTRVPSAKPNTVDLISNSYEPASQPRVEKDKIYISGSLYLNVPVGATLGLSTVSEWNTYLSTHNLQVVYPFATPQTYQLTAQQITTLVGKNVMWSNTGNIAVTYAIFSEDLNQALTNIRETSTQQLNIATQEISNRFDWTDEEISKAATVATNYIDAFSTDGIDIHAARDTETPDENPSSIYIGNQQISLIHQGKPQVIISENGVSIYNADKNDGQPIAQYGETVIIGKVSEPHVQIDSKELGFYEPNGASADAYLTNNQLFIQKTVTREVAIGEEEIVDSETNNVRFVPKQQWSWKTHKNINGQNNLGLRWGG